MKKIVLCTGLLALAQASMALDFSPYGSARYGTYREFYTGDSSTGKASVNDIGLAGNSRFGATLAQDPSTGVSGRAEFGYSGGNPTVRRLYGEWKASEDLSLMVGKEWSLINFTHSNQVWNADNDMWGQGAITEVRVEQIRLTSHGASIAIVTGKTTAMGKYSAQPDNLPKFEAAYAAPGIGPVDLSLAGGYTGYTVALPTGTAPTGGNSASYDIDCYVIAADAAVKLNPATIGISVGYAQNPAEYGLQNSEPTMFMAAPDATGKLQNDAALMATADVNVALGRFIPEVGVGYEGHSNNSMKSTTLGTYLQVEIDLAKGVSLTPEAGMKMGSIDKNDGKGSVDDPTYNYFGMKTQINF